MCHGRRVSLGQKKVLGEEGQLGRGPARRDQANPKDCNPSLGQSRAGQGLLRTLGQPQSQPWRKWCLNWQRAARQSRTWSPLGESSLSSGEVETPLRPWVPQMSKLSREAIAARLGQAQQGLFGAQE